MFISKKANVGNRVLLGENIRIFGKVIINDYVMIEDNVTIGYPTLDEIDNSKVNLFNKNCVSSNEYLDAISNELTVIKSGSHIKIGTTIYGGSVINENVDCGQNVIIRDFTIVGTGSFVYPNVLIGREVNIGDYCRIAGTICNRSIIGNFSTMLGHMVHTNRFGIPGIIEESPLLGIGVNVGRESVIVGKIKIDDFSILATNSVLTRDLPSKVLAAGNPARIVKHFLEDDLKPLKEYIKLKSNNNNG